MLDVPVINNRAELVYLDNNATTTCYQEVVDAMRPYWTIEFANPSSTHLASRRIQKQIHNARESVASVLNVQPYQIFFNSGATEGNNWIFDSFALSNGTSKKIAISCIEHKSALLAARALRERGFDIIELPVNKDGVVVLEVARQLISDEVGLVAVQLANNETGVIQPIDELVAIAHGHGAFFHCDAVQGLGKMPVDLASLEVDSAVFSGHKIHGPKGIGVLYLRSGSRSFPWQFASYGGGQEQGVRSGTLNVPGIIGIAKACDMLRPVDINHMNNLKTILERGIKKIFPDSIIHGESVMRIANTTNVAIPGIPADILMANLPLFCISSGSACNSGAIGVSYVLEAMGMPIDEARSSIRLSTSAQTSEHEIHSFLLELEKIRGRM